MQRGPGQIPVPLGTNCSPWVAKVGRRREKAKEETGMQRWPPPASPPPPEGRPQPPYVATPAQDSKCDGHKHVLEHVYPSVQQVTIRKRTCNGRQTACSVERLESPLTSSQRIEPGQGAVVACDQAPWRWTSCVPRVDPVPQLQAQLQPRPVFFATSKGREGR